MHARQLKTLGLSLIALVAVMAVNAAGAQAVWNLNGGTTDAGGALLLSLTGTVLEGELLITVSGLEINCTSGDLTASLATNNAMTSLTATVHVLFLNCTELNFGATCTVMSPGQPAGRILASGSGSAAMNGTETYILLTSTEFTRILFDGAECPLLGLNQPVSGSVRLVVENPETAMATHLVTIDEEGLFFGEELAELDGPAHAPKGLAHVQKFGGGNWAIQLQGL